ncbi:unnamed protein product [Adineta steineri]|uniref:Uncharacterized protein n=1 Tax=Adineta steineri TaxID=433720 RepID=A0A816FR59_9BILA|nr:unnamed protein product [Adineta steineri]CAF1348835.1 unnamed protein product [Adineta steineri]CAF1435651.1 unnamed protein product [Adineta steineri]CAF1664678.1 unnamed protein product [Adineta steineri]
MLLNILKSLEENRENCITKYFFKYQITADNQFRSMMSSGSSIISAIIFCFNRCNNENNLLKFDSLNSDVFGYHIVQFELCLDIDEYEVNTTTLLT